MRIIVFSTKPYDRRFLDAANERHGFRIDYLDARLSAVTARLAAGADVVCAFVNDAIDASAINALAAAGVRMIALRCAGFNNVDRKAAAQAGIVVGRVPAYSPHAVAEHAIALMLALNRRIHRAYNRVREGNFALDGLLGFDLHGKTVGVVGTGNIGQVVVRILRGFGCTVLASDPHRSEECIALGARYVTNDALFSQSDIVTIHCPLTPDTYHLIDAKALSLMKPGVMLINTSRGAIVDTRAVIAALKAERLASLGLDVYEEEADLFFEDLSDRVIQDEVFARLLTFPNVLITGHQGFFTGEAMRNIADTTLDNVAAFARTGRALHPVPEDKPVLSSGGRESG
ncbi:MAG TPA: 2-hydroxyacid dehydrogenase [Burkholderiaceae bacterium]|nr:2-hydroxyacid dehydrogenase [Burkholderiaceae bacterium]